MSSFLTYSNDAELIEWVRAWKPTREMNDVPGVPLSRFSIAGGTMDDVRRLIDSGDLEVVQVTRSPLFDGGKPQVKSFIRVTDGR